MYLPDLRQWLRAETEAECASWCSGLVARTGLVEEMQTEKVVCRKRSNDKSDDQAMAVAARVRDSTSVEVAMNVWVG